MHSVPLDCLLKRAIAGDCKTQVQLDSIDAAMPALPTFPSIEQEELQTRQESDHHIAQVVKWVKTGHKPTDRQMGIETNNTKKLLKKWDKLEMNKNSAEGVIAPAGAKVTGATIRTWLLNKFISFLAVLTWKTGLKRM